jgi:site-specific recombinase XerD
MLNLPVHGPPRPDPLIRSFERHLYAENRSARTVTTYLIAVRQANILRERGASLEAATRGDLEAFLGDLLSRRMASTAATYHKVLKILYGWLAEEEEIPTNPILSADSSPASVNILVPREDLNLQPPDSHTGALSPELHGQGWC